MEHDFTPDDAAPWPEKPEKADPVEPLAGIPSEPDVPAASGGRRQIILGAFVVLLAGAGALALLGSRESSPAVAAAPRPRVAARPAAAPAAPAVVSWTENAPSWASNHEAWLGSNTGAAVEVLAASPVGVWMRNVRPALVVRCRSKRAEVFVFTDSAAAIEAGSEDHSVSFAVDGGEVIPKRWPDATAHNAQFAPDGEGLARRLLLSETFTFTFTPHNAPSVTARFKTSGLAEALKPAGRHCGW